MVFLTLLNGKPATKWEHFSFSYIINSSNANTEKPVHLGDLKYLMKCNNSEYMIIYVIYFYTC